MKPKLHDSTPAGQPPQESRVAEALRDNLRKRKQQQAARHTAAVKQDKN